MLERDKETNMNSIERSRAQTGAGSSNIKLQDHNHNREVIFALPSLRLHFKTEHVQGPTTPDSAGKLHFLLFFHGSLYVTRFLKPSTSIEYSTLKSGTINIYYLKSLFVTVHAAITEVTQIFV